MAQATTTTATAAAAAAAAASAPDTRNLHWKQNNVGSTLLQKMGWKHGQVLGSQHRQRGATERCGDGGAGEEEENAAEHSGEGLKIVRRPDGLGLGASARRDNVGSTSHASFSELLETLKREHAVAVVSRTENRKKRKKSQSKDGGDGADEKPSKTSGSEKKKQKTTATTATTAAAAPKKKETIFATNKITHARVRQAKFVPKTASEMACIFGKDYSSAEIADQTLTMVKAERKLRRERQQADKLARQDDAVDEAALLASETGNKQAEEDRRRKRKEEKRRKRKEEKSSR